MLIASKYRKGCFFEIDGVTPRAEPKGARIGELCVATDTLLAKDGFGLEFASGDFSDGRPSAIFYSEGEAADLYVNPHLIDDEDVDQYYRVSVIIKGLPVTEEEELTASAWRHYIIWRDKEHIYATPYCATYPIMGGLAGYWDYDPGTISYASTYGVNYIEARGYSGESVTIINWSYYRLRYDITKEHPDTGIDVITTPEILPGEGYTVDPDDEFDLRAITRIEIDDTSPALPDLDRTLPFYYIFFAKPELQNPAVKVPSFG